MEGIEEGQEDNFAVPTQDPVATAAPAPSKVKVKPFDAEEYELPFTEDELKELKKVDVTKEEKKVLKYLEEKLYDTAETLTKDEVASLINEIPEKYIKRVLADFKYRSDIKPTSGEPKHFGFGTSNIVKDAFESTKKLKDNSVAKKNYQQFLTKILDKYQTHEQSEKLAQKEEERLDKERKSIKTTINKILDKDESVAKQHIKDLPLEEREAFNKAYKDHLAEMYKNNPDGKALFEASSKRIKSVFDKAVLEKSKQDKLVKAIEEAKKKALFPQDKEAEPTQQRTLSRGRSLLRSKSATREEAIPEEQKKVQVAPVAAKEAQKSQESPSKYKRFREAILNRNEQDLLDQRPFEERIGGELDLPTREQINEALENNDKKKLKEFADLFEGSTLNPVNKTIANVLNTYAKPSTSARGKELLNQGDILNKLKRVIPKLFKVREEELNSLLESKPEFKEDFERVKKARETGESFRDQEELARNRSGKRGVLPATTLKTDLDQEIDEEAFQEAAKDYPGDVRPKPQRLAQTILPEKLEPKDAEGNPMDLTAYIKSTVLKALYDKTNHDLQNPPKIPAYIGEDSNSILANELRSQFAQHGNPLADQYTVRVHELAEAMVRNQLIEQAAEIANSSPDETMREEAKRFILDSKLVNQATSRITGDPSFKENIQKHIDDETYQKDAANLLKPDTEYEANVAETLREMPDLTPDINFELSDEEKELHEANVKSFMDQALRNFERTDLRRAKNRYSGQNVWNSGLANRQRSEVWQDFNRHMADKQLQMLNEAKQQSFLKKKELHEQKSRQAQALLQKSRAWLDTNVSKNRNQTEMANALAGLQGLNLQRAKNYTDFESVLNAGRQGDVQALAALELTQNQAAQLFARMQHDKDQNKLQQASTLGNIGSQHHGQLINASNAYGNMATQANQNLNDRINAGFASGDRRRQGLEALDRHGVEAERASRDYQGQNLTGLLNTAKAAEGQDVQETPGTFFSNPAPTHIPGLQQPNNTPITDTAALLIGGAGALGNWNNQNLANQALEATIRNRDAQTNLVNAQTKQTNQIPQIPVGGTK